MLTNKFYRDVYAKEHLELFLLVGAASLLLVRLYLFLTGFPQIGGGGLHIAHMLWGGLLMMGALIISLSFRGRYKQRIVAIIGGAGFGVFIDELGKFITQDHNYFYQPAVALIYVVFLILYFVIKLASRPRPLTSREYQLHALSLFEEALLYGMTAKRKELAKSIISQADQTDPISHSIGVMIRDTPAMQTQKMSRAGSVISTTRSLFSVAESRRVRALYRLSLVVEVVIFILGGIAMLAGNIIGAEMAENNDVIAIGMIVSTLVSGVFVVLGLLQGRSSRFKAFKQFRRAVLVNLFLPQFLYFAQFQFMALPSLLFSIALLSFIDRQLLSSSR